MQEEFNLFPSGQALELCVHGAITSSHSSNVSANTLPALKAKGAAFDYIQALLCPWNGKQMAEQVGCQSIPLAALVGESNMG